MIVSKFIVIRRNRLKALIIAAGMGTRLSDMGDSKPMITVQGKPLIEWTITRAQRAGIDEFVVVTGYNREKLEPYLNKLSAEINIPVTTVFNPEWTKPNGLSVLSASPFLKEQFILLMSDHLFDPGILEDLIKEPMDHPGIILGVDTRIDNNPLVDMEDVTRVLQEGRNIVNINKLIDDYNAFDTGMFKCDPALFKAIESSAEKGEFSLSGGIKTLASEGNALTMDIGSRFWLDVDDEAGYKKAEEYNFNI